MRSYMAWNQIRDHLIRLELAGKMDGFADEIVRRIIDAELYRYRLKHRSKVRREQGAKSRNRVFRSWPYVEVTGGP